VLLQVTQPRMPCFKLSLRFGRPDMVKLFWKSNRSGVYFSIEEEGEMAAGDEVTLVDAHPLRLTVGEVVALYKGEKSDPDLIRRALEVPLASSWKQGIQELHERRTH
jgi:MOSC domain-containing protein YiiM